MEISEFVACYYVRLYRHRFTYQTQKYSSNTHSSGCSSQKFGWRPPKHKLSLTAGTRPHFSPVLAHFRLSPGGGASGPRKARAGMAPVYWCASELSGALVLPAFTTAQDPGSQAEETNSTVDMILLRLLQPCLQVGSCCAPPSPPPM